MTTPNLNDIGQALANIGPLKELQQMAPGDNLFLVGGALRDALIGHPVNDIDIVAVGDPTDVARQFAEKFSAPWFWLDKKRGQSRVLINNDVPLTFDFAPLRAADLAADLAARDFTINSLALPLAGPLVNERIIDPLNGLDDISSSQLRMSGAQVLSTDPLRILKGLRHAVTLGFILEEETCQTMIRCAWQLKYVAFERIRQEVWTILSHPSAPHGIQLLSSTGVGRIFWGDEYDDRLPDLVQTLSRCRAAWQSLAGQAEGLQAWLQETVEPGLTRAGLLLWTLLLSRLNAQLPAACAEEWLFSRRAQARIRSLSALGDASFAEFRRVARQPRAFGLWAQKNGQDLVDLLLAAPILAAQGAGLGEAEVLDLMQLVEQARLCSLDDLVGGDWLVAEMNIPPGPEVGKLLARLRDAEIDGLVNDEASARDYLRNYCQFRD